MLKCMPYSLPFNQVKYSVQPYEIVVENLQNLHIHDFHLFLSSSHSIHFPLRLATNTKIIEEYQENSFSELKLNFVPLIGRTDP